MMVALPTPSPGPRSQVKDVGKVDRGLWAHLRGWNKQNCFVLP